MNPNIIKNFLNSISDLSDDAFGVLNNQFTEQHFAKGEYFAKEGRYENTFGILTYGVVRAFYRNEEGVEYNKAFDQAPAIIGAYSSLITGNKNFINIQCLTDCTVMVANYTRFVELFTNFKEIETLSRKLSERYFVLKEQKEIELVLLDADKRYEIFKKNYPDLEQLIPQYHIASYLGITPTQLSRIRKSLARK